METDTSLEQKAKQAEMDLTLEIPEPPVILSVQSVPLFFLGDFSLIIGKAKSRKTFLNSLLMAVLVENTNIGHLKAMMPDDKRTVIFFDTEQGMYHAHKATKRVLNLLGINSIHNFRAYSLRKYSTKERLLIIEYVIYNTPNIGAVFIDGIRDLVTSINDEEQATVIASKLMKWSEELNIHIVCTLHMNKGDNNARGHLGTELLNKSLVTIAVSKCGPEGKYSKVVVTESREREPVPFMFEIDQDGLPCLISDNPASYMQIDKGKQGLDPEKFSREEHFEKLTEIFSKTEVLPYGKLVTAVQDKYKFGKNKAKQFVKHFLTEKQIAKEKRGNTTIYGMV